MPENKRAAARQGVLPSMLHVPPRLRETTAGCQKVLSIEVTKGAPEGEQKGNQEEQGEGNPPPSIT
jgi:hypothetical protein